ncbi:MAG: 4Fe-4S dicluster-binding protein [Fusobacteriaceae bacterium]
MSHMTARNAYKSLEERLNNFPQGAPPSETLYKILKILFSEKEAELVSQLPIKPFTAKKAAEIWGIPETEAIVVLEELASRAVLLDILYKGVRKYVLPPPMAGFFEFSIMRTNGKLDQQALSELFYQYLNVEEEFVRKLLIEGETKMGRVLANEYALSLGRDSDPIQILDWEKATYHIEQAKHIGVSMCYCRHKMQHIGKACKAPMEICMTFGNVADSLIRHGHARRIDADECKKLLQEAYDNNLVQCAENVRDEIAFICNCCGCCCEFLMAAKKYGALHSIATSNFIPKVKDENCIKCKKCVRICPINAISFSENSVKIDEEICIGCGVCGRNCPVEAIILEEREKKIIPPLSTAHRVVLMAIERGKLAQLIFDNKALYSHRVMGTILGSILKLPLSQRILANNQVKSKYLGALLKDM